MRKPRQKHLSNWVPAWYRRADERTKRHQENTACRIITQRDDGEALAIRRRPTVRWTWV